MRNENIAKKKLDAIAKRIGYRKVYYVVLSRMLNEAFRSLKVRFKFVQSPDLDEYFIFTGEFNPHIDGRDNIYSVYIGRSLEHKYIKPRKGFFDELYLVLVHEFRHSYQYRKRNNRIIPEPKNLFFHKNLDIQENVRYLSDRDEIDAHAYEASFEIRMKNITFSEALAKLEHVQKYKKYLKKHSPDDWKQFIKKLYLHYHK